jgi:hypothetical protein
MDGRQAAAGRRDPARLSAACRIFAGKAGDLDRHADVAPAFDEEPAGTRRRRSVFRVCLLDGSGKSAYSVLRFDGTGKNRKDALKQGVREMGVYL